MVKYPWQREEHVQRPRGERAPVTLGEPNVHSNWILQCEGVGVEQ